MYAKSIHDEIHEMIMHGQGWNFELAYKLPRWLRKFYCDKIAKTLEKQAELMKSQKHKR